MIQQFGAHFSHLPTQISTAIFRFLIRILFFINKRVLSILLLIALVLTINFFLWTKFLNREFLCLGWGSQIIVENFKIGFIIFIFSEIIFFTSFFWVFFHFILINSFERGVDYCGRNIYRPDYKCLALSNTLLLLRRGFTLTLAHLFLLNNKPKQYLVFLRKTLFLGLIFLTCQFVEFKQLRFLWSDRIYPSIFYMTTRFHGRHVFIGVVMLLYVFLKTTPNIFIVFEIVSWYWHFVDVIWLFLFCFFYWAIKF